MIASKLEQESHPSVHDFTNIADHCFQASSQFLSSGFLEHLQAACVKHGWLSKVRLDLYGLLKQGHLHYCTAFKYTICDTDILLYVIKL